MAIGRFDILWSTFSCYCWVIVILTRSLTPMWLSHRRSPIQNQSNCWQLTILSTVYLSDFQQVPFGLVGLTVRSLPTVSSYSNAQLSCDSYATLALTLALLPAMLLQNWLRKRSEPWLSNNSGYKSWQLQFMKITSLPSCYKLVVKQSIFQQHPGWWGNLSNYGIIYRFNSGWQLSLL